ncbi:MAG: type II toxin-antitoxin system HicB family antitoxin [Chloroflexota bacterium]|nr:type II toxin-antitoxin system HicB family antitoxin [Chloroflexota bacterium]
MEIVKTKDLEYYLGLRYQIVLVPEDDGWGAIIAELPGCVGAGDTIPEALAMLDDAKRGWMAATLDRGYPIPEPGEIKSPLTKV